MIPSTLAPSVALAAYAEPFVAGRRVVVFGDATSGLAEYLVDRGARLVHVYDHEPARIAEASSKSTSRSISFAPLGQAGIAVRDGAFDFGLIENLAFAPDPGEILQRLARALSARGAAIVAVPNPDARLKLLLSTGNGGPASAVGYYELYDRVAEHFQEVKMLGQLPFVGYAVADFSPEHEPNISIDTALIPGGAEEPEWFLALASQQPIESDAFTIVELPFSQVLRPGQDPALDPALSRARAQEQVLLERIGQLEAESAQLKETKKHVAEQQGAFVQTELKQQIIELKEQIGKRDAWLVQLEARAATADTRADRAEAELEKLKHQTAKTAPPPGSSQSELQKERDAFARERDALLTERDALQSADGELRKRLSELQAQDEQARNEVTKFEALLKERSSLIQRLERELKEAERIASELARDLTEARRVSSEATQISSDAELAELRGKLDNLAFANAEREANLLAADWTISELEAKLSALSANAAITLEASGSALKPSQHTQEDQTSPLAATPR